MVHNNKVLTVSYGTFSCTLEGFEDSFGTMKAIAEYFRDLASDDRYFGAEPPQPDAEMLARIAQREVSRQVEARTSRDGIHLRTAAPNDPPAQLVPAAVSAPTNEPVPASEADANSPAKVQPQARSLAQDTTEVDPSTVDLFEDDLPELDAAPDAAAEAAAIEATPAAEPQEQEIQAQEANQGPAATVDLATIAAISAAVSEAPSPDAPASDETGAEDVEFFDDEIVAEPVAASPQEAPAAESIAAKLQRIRAVVSQTADKEEFSEDEHAESFVETARAELAQVQDEDLEGHDTEVESDEISRVLDRLDLTGEFAVEEEAEQQNAPTSESSELDPSSDSLIASVLQDPTSTPEAEPQPEQDGDTAADVEEAPARPKRGIRLTRRKTVEASAPSTPEPEAKATLETQVEDSLAEPAHVTPVDSSAAENTPNAAKPLRARIVKVKRAELEQAMTSGNLEEVTEEDAAEAQDTMPQVESSLDADEEADLLRELAEVEAELLASNQDDEGTQPAPEETAQPEHVEEAATSAPSSAKPTSSGQPKDAPDSDVNRLMEAAASKLEDPDNATSRETYSHLRAAVAAAEADRSAGDNSVQKDESEAYREDLANVVRPRRPDAASAAKAPRPRSAGSRPAPLKLVAEQRIDPQPQAAAAPVRPRRISSPVEETSPAQAEAFGSFTDFVRDQGAAELHELLEAAASYLSFVEGRDHFSRPQLMNKVRSVGHGDFNRENGLRSIGQLLREGKIERSDNGHFSATDVIGFRPQKRAAG